MLSPLSNGDPCANRGQEQLGRLPHDQSLCFAGHGCLYGLAQPLTYICIDLHRFACIRAVLRFLSFACLYSWVDCSMCICICSVCILQPPSPQSSGNFKFPFLSPNFHVCDCGIHMCMCVGACAGRTGGLRLTSGILNHHSTLLRQCLSTKSSSLASQLASGDPLSLPFEGRGIGRLLPLPTLMLFLGMQIQVHTRSRQGLNHWAISQVLILC